MQLHVARRDFYFRDGCRGCFAARIARETRLSTNERMMLSDTRSTSLTMPCLYSHLRPYRYVGTGSGVNAGSTSNTTIIIITTSKPPRRRSGFIEAAITFAPLKECVKVLPYGYEQAFSRIEIASTTIDRLFSEIAARIRANFS